MSWDGLIRISMAAPLSVARAMLNLVAAVAFAHGTKRDRSVRAVGLDCVLRMSYKTTKQGKLAVRWMTNLSGLAQLVALETIS